MDNNEFTEIEKYWYSVKEDCDKQLENEDYDDKDKYIARSLSKCIDMTIRFENLRDPNEDICRRRRLVRIKKPLPTKVLEFYGYDFVLFNGIYIAHDVIFVKKEIGDLIFMRKARESEIGLPSDTMFGTSKDVYFKDTYNTYYACLAKSGFTERYGIYYRSSWEYVYF